MTTTGSNSVSTPQRGVLCPYCGHTQADGDRCESCRGLFEPLSRQASQNAMGAWSIRDEANPFRPGCSYQTIQRLAARGRIRADTIIRGPTTRQFWAAARNVPGVANLLGECHNCHGPATPDEYMCRTCGAVFVAPTDRQQLGLAPIRLLPGEASPEAIAETSTPPAVKPTLEPTLNGPGVPISSPSHASPVASHSDRQPPRAHPAAASTRRLRRQVASLRALTLLLGIVVCVLLATVILMAAMTGQRQGETAVEDGRSARQADPAGAEASNRAGASVPRESNSRAEQPSGADGPTIPATPEGTSIEADEATLIIEQALEAAEKDTIDDLERAVQMLERLRDQLPEDRRPADLDGHIDRLNDRIEELSLTRFQPDRPAPIPN